MLYPRPTSHFTKYSNLSWRRTNSKGGHKHKPRHTHTHKHMYGRTDGIRKTNNRAAQTLKNQLTVNEERRQRPNIVANTAETCTTKCVLLRSKTVTALR